MWRSWGTYFDSIMVLAIAVFSSISFLGYWVGVVFASVDLHAEGKGRRNIRN